MNRSLFQRFALCTALSLAATAVVSAGTLTQLQVTPLQINPLNDPSTNVAFPTAGDAYCSATNGCGNIPVGGQTAFQWTTGDYVISSIFTLPTDSVTDLTADWSYQNFLGDGNTETWYVYVNGVAVAQASLPDDSFNGDILSVTGTVDFAGIGPVAGGYQVELVLQNTVDFAGGSAAWLDGGVTSLSYSATPEPGSLLLIGSGLGLAGLLLRRKRRQ